MARSETQLRLYSFFRKCFLLSLLLAAIQRILKFRTTVILCVFVALFEVQAELKLTQEKGITDIFEGRDTTIPIFVLNNGSEETTTVLNTRLYQASSSIMAPLGIKKEWKTIRISNGQTVFEEFVLNLVETKTPTLFILKVYDHEKEIGSVKIRGYPDNIWEKIRGSFEGIKLRVIDPETRIGPLLEEKKISFERLENFEEVSREELVIAGPFANKQGLSEELATELETLRTRGISMVLFMAATLMPDNVLPFEIYESAGSRVILADQRYIENLATSPSAQLHFLRAIESAKQRNHSKLPLFKK
jgi:hypothetical protein